MKKFIFVFVAMMAISFAACGNGQTKGDTTANDSDSVVVDTIATDTIAVDTTAVDSNACNL